MLHKPHSPYIRQRDTLDDGFSKGWGFHFQPSEEYVIDCHTHFRVPGGKEEDVINTLNHWFSYTEAFRQQKLIALIENKDQFELFHNVSVKDSRLHWMYWPKIDEPDLSAIQKAHELGACGLKLHNNRIMQGEVPMESWESPQWQEVFTFLNEHKIPVLWHVTQRVGYSPYHGGGFNSYFSEGQAKGICVTNRQLVEQLCRIMDGYPNIPIIAAHQMYMNLENMAALMDRYPQLNFDTTVGFFIRRDDTIYEEDREIYYSFIMKYADRLLFGTDTDMRPDTVNFYQVEAFLCHLRFIHQLRLPYDQLQLILYRNSERIFGLPPSNAARKHNSRP